MHPLLKNRILEPSLQPTCHCHKENNSIPYMPFTKCSMQSPFIPEVTSSNSLKTRMLFLRTWYIVVFTVNASQSNCATWKIWDLLIIQYNGKTKATRIENKNHTSHPFTCSPSELKLSTPRNIEILVCLNCWWWNLKVQWIVFYFPVIILKNPWAPKLQTVEVTEESS